MTRLLALWRKEFIALSRDRHGLAALFIMPAIFVLVMSLALRDAFTPTVNSNLQYAVLDADNSKASQALIKQLPGAGVVQPTTALVGNETALRDEATLREAVRSGQIAFVLVIPKDFDRAIRQPRDSESPPLLTIWADPALSPLLHGAFRLQAQGALGSLQAETLINRVQPLLGGIDIPIPEAVDWQRQIKIETVQQSRSAALPSAVQQSVPAWLIFSMFFVVIPMSALFIVERRDGALQRLYTQGVPFYLILIGKLLPFIIVNQIQALFMVIVGRYLVPLMGGEALQLPDGAGAAFALWAMTAAISLAAVSWALFIASLARTTEQATVFGGVGNILMGAIGGVMVPKFIMPPAMQALTIASPMAWALEGFHTIMLRGGSLADLALPIGALLAMAAVVLLLAVTLNLRFNWKQP